MKKSFLFLLCILFCCCSTARTDNYNDDQKTSCASKSNVIMEQTKERQVYNFEEVPVDLLGKIEEMGTDTSSVLNEYEAKYLNFIFKLDTGSFSLVGKKIGFLGSKKAFFKDERERLLRGETGVGGCGLYIFNATQKEKSGGYDAAIVYWCKFVLPVDKVVERLKSSKSL